MRKVIYIIIILSLLLIFFLTQLLFVKKQIKSITEQLRNYNIGKTNKKIDIILLDKEIESIASEINNLIDLHIQSNAEKKFAEREPRQAIANISHDLRTP